MRSRLVEVMVTVTVAVMMGGLALAITDSQLTTAYSHIRSTGNFTDTRTTRRHCRTNHGRVSRMGMVMTAILLLQEAHPLIRLLLTMGFLFSRGVRVEVQQRHHRWDADGRSVVMTEREMVMVGGAIRVVAVVEFTTGQCIRLSASLRAVQACLLDESGNKEREKELVFLALFMPDAYCNPCSLSFIHSFIHSQVPGIPTLSQ